MRNFNEISNFKRVRENNRSLFLQKKEINTCVILQVLCELVSSTANIAVPVLLQSGDKFYGYFQYEYENKKY